jgi:hypothetical protein
MVKEKILSVPFNTVQNTFLSIFDLWLVESMDKDPWIGKVGCPPVICQYDSFDRIRTVG